jgi:mannosylglycoprotein endo-beta-mannosidase
MNARGRKNYIQRLKNDRGWVTDHRAKEQVVQTHFQSVMSKGDTSSVDFNWDAINLQESNLSTLGDAFSKDEVRNAINQMPSDKALGPDGFTGIFFKKCWGIIKDDIMKVIERFGNLHVHNFHWLNSANIVLLPKKEGAEEVTNYRPIILIHAIAKIIAKMLVVRLAPFMNDLVSNAQSAFIKKRSIHGNFLYVKNLATRFNKAKPRLFSSSLTFARPLTLLNGSTFLTFCKGEASPPGFAIGSPPYSLPPCLGCF